MTKPGARASGFTLLELIVVLLIISVMMAVVAPRLAGRSQAATLRGAGHDLQTLATAARARALLSGRSVALLLGDNGELRLVSQSATGTDTDSNAGTDMVPRRRLPQGVSVRFIPEGDSDAALIRFHPDGSADGGELSLQGRSGGELRMQLVAPLGRLRLATAP